MKKIILLTVVIILYLGVSAQNKPTKGTSGLGLNYRLGNVRIPAIKYDYYISNSWVFTASYAPNFRISSTNSSIEENQAITTNKLGSYSQVINLGIEHHFLPKLKIDPFLGLSLSHGLSTQDKSIQNSEFIDFNGNIRKQKQEITLPLSNSISPILNLGFNYFILNNFSVGIQLNLGNRFRFINGERKSFSSELLTDPDGNILYENEQDMTEKINEFSSNMFYTVELKTAFYFPLKKKKE